MVCAYSVRRLHRICRTTAQLRSSSGLSRCHVKAQAVVEGEPAVSNMATTASVPYDDLCAKLREMNSLAGAHSLWLFLYSPYLSIAAS